MPNSTQIVAALRLASALHEQADLIRCRAQTLAAAGAALRWKSSATTLFDHRLEGALSTLYRCAGEFDNAAAAINRLAVVTG